MPNTKGAKKRLRQSLVRRDRNRAERTRLRHSLRKFREAITAKDLDTAQSISHEATRLLVRAAARRIFPRTEAA